MLALSNCMVIGDRRKYLAMVISLKTVMDTETGASTDNLAPDSLHVGKQVQYRGGQGIDVMSQCSYCLHLSFTLLSSPCLFDSVFYCK